MTATSNRAGPFFPPSLAPSQTNAIKWFQLRLLAQAGTQFNALITANAYISFVLFFLLIVGGTFETPLVILSLAFLGVVSPQTLRREWRIAYMVIAGIAVFGTPDWSPVTMLLVAIPMALLYEFSLILCRIFVRPVVPQPVRET